MAYVRESAPTCNICHSNKDVYWDDMKGCWWCKNCNKEV